MAPDTPDSVRQTVRDFILREFLPSEDPAALLDTTPLISGGVMDSISTVRLVSHLEDRFGIKLEQYEITVKRFDSVNQIVDTVEEKLRRQV